LTVIFYHLPISTTAEDALTRDEVEALRRDMSADEFAREMMCSFFTPVAGAYYSESLNALRLAGRVAAVAPDLAADVITAWDLGIDDYTAIWLFQVCGTELHFLCYIEDAGRNLEHYAREILKAKAHFLPHDVEAREYATDESRKDTLTRLLTAPIYTVPRNNPEDGISGVRRLLAKSWFDATGCRLGLSRLAGYHRNKSGKPAHDDNCHGADALRLPLVTGMSLSRYSSFSHPGPLRRRLRASSEGCFTTSPSSNFTVDCSSRLPASTTWMVASHAPQPTCRAAGLFLKTNFDTSSATLIPCSPRPGEPRHRLRNPVQLSPEQVIENGRVPRGEAIKVDRLHLKLARRGGEVHSMLRQRPKHSLKIKLLNLRR
jgi:hypothetical protein